MSSRDVAAVLLICLVPRILYLLWAGPPAEAAGMYYWELSDSLLRHGVLGGNGQRSTEYELLYPLFLTVSRWLANDDLAMVMLLQMMVAAVGAVWFFRLCRLLSPHSAVAWIGVAMYGLNPYLVRQSDAIIEITLVATLLIVCAWHFSRANSVRGAVACGVAFGLTLLARTAVMPVFLLAAAWMLVVKPKAGAVMVLAALFMVAPMSARNYLEDGSWVLTRSGVNLMLGNSEYSDRFIPEHNTDLLSIFFLPKLTGRDPQLAELSAVELDRAYTRKAMEFMADNPLRTLRLKLLNAWYFLQPRLVPYYGFDENTRVVPESGGGVRIEGATRRPAVVEAVHAVVSGFLVLTALAGMYYRRREARADLILYAILLGFIAVSAVYYPATRLRAPAEFVFMFFSACAVARWLRLA